MPASRSAALSAQIRAAEAAALARGIAWSGLSPAQAAILLAHLARDQPGLGAAASIRMQAAVGAFAVRHGLLAFERGIAAYLAEVERHAALERQGYPTRPPVLPIAPTGARRRGSATAAMPVMPDASNRVGHAMPRFDAAADTSPGS
jgi:hypothetical protein